MNLKTILAVETIKLNNRQFPFVVLTYLSLTTFISFVIFGTWNLPPAETELHLDLKTLNPFGRMMGMFAPHLALIPSLYYIMKIGNEYRHGTIRKNIMDGMSRNDVYNGQLIFLFASYLFFILFFLIIFSLYGSYRLRGSFGLIEFINSIQLPQVIKFTFYLFFYGSLSNILITATRSSTISIFILLGLLFIESMLVMVLQRNNMAYITDYMPFESATRIRIADVVPTKDILIFLTYMLSFFGISHVLILKKDL